MTNPSLICWTVSGVKKRTPLLLGAPDGWDSARFFELFSGEKPLPVSELGSPPAVSNAKPSGIFDSLIGNEKWV